MTDNDREKMLVMMQTIPRWTDEAGRIVSPNAVLKTAADLLMVLAKTLDDGYPKAKAAVNETSAFIRMIAESATETMVSKVGQA